MHLPAMEDGPELEVFVVDDLLLVWWRRVEIIIGTTGELQIDAVGFKGPDCEKATAFLEEALGVVGQKTKKPEYHQHSTRNQQRVGG